MDKIKNAITSLEQAVLKLESAVHDEKKERGAANEKIIELWTNPPPLKWFIRLSPDHIFPFSSSLILAVPIFKSL